MSGRDRSKTPRVVSAREAEDISARLFSAKTKSIANEPCKFNALHARDVISARDKTSSDVDAIAARLSSAHTKAWSAEPCKALPAVAEPKDGGLTKAYEIEDMVDRLVTSPTRAFSGLPCKVKPLEADNSLAREPVSEQERNEILHRLNKTHTKSSQGAPCKDPDEPNTPGLGTKCLPVIEGLEKRFKGQKSDENKVKDIFNRLSSASTRSSRARYENARILLYPERTLLCNNVERIVSYQNTGATVKQEVLARREKWFN